MRDAVERGKRVCKYHSYAFSSRTSEQLPNNSLLIHESFMPSGSVVRSQSLFKSIKEMIPKSYEQLIAF